MVVNLTKTSRKTIVCLALLVLTLAVFWQVRHFDFVNLDDKMYIHENHHVLSGLTVDGVKWAFTSFYASNWHPLTWLSHMLDVDLFGLNAGRMHLVNVFFHLAATLLLFLILDHVTGALGRSALVAALFALHPLHVESVAWIAERKDVLSAFFWMLTLGAYVLYKEKKHPGAYLAAQGRTEEAIAHYTKAIQLEPDYFNAHNNLGLARAARREFKEAALHFQAAVQIRPGTAGVHYNLAVALVSLGDWQAAERSVREALRIDPNFAEAHNDLGMMLAMQGKVEEGMVHFREALRLKPGYAEAAHNLRLAQGSLGK